MSYQKKLKQYQQKWLTKNLINGYIILHQASIFLQEHYKIIEYIFHTENI